MSGADEAAQLLDPELARIERLLVEAATSQLERLLDAEGRPTTVTAEQRDMIARAAKKTVDRQSLRTVLALCSRSDDEIRSRMIDKLGGTIRAILDVTAAPVPHA